MPPERERQARGDLPAIVAINHPLRRRLLELLSVKGPATASLLAAETNQLVGNISHHLKVLATAGLVEEALELAKNRRERWWRGVPVALSFAAAEAKGDPAAHAVVLSAEQLNLNHEVAKVQAWWAMREDYPEVWQSADFSTAAWVQATPSELKELAERLAEVITQFRDRIGTGDDDGDGDGDGDGDVEAREHAFVFVHGVPARP